MVDKMTDLEERRPLEVNTPPDLPLQDNLVDIMGSDSDGSSFLDDDTADLLPSAWVGKEKEKKPHPDYKPRKRGRTTEAPPPANSTQPAANRKLSLKQDAKKTTSSSSLDVTMSSLSIRSIEAKSPVELTQSTVSVSRLEVPISLVRPPRSTIEILQEQIKTLKHEIEKKNRDVKSANQRAAASEKARLQAEDERRDTLSEMESKSQILERALQTSAKSSAVTRELQSERNDIEGQCHKATSELKKLRERHEVTVKWLAESGKKLSIANEDLNNANSRLNTIAIEKGGLDLTIGRLERAAVAYRSEQTRLRQTLIEEQSRSTALQSQSNDLHSRIDTASTLHLSNRSAVIELRSAQRANEEHKRNYDTAIRTMDRQKLMRKEFDSSKVEIESRDLSIKHLQKERDALNTTQTLLEPLVKIRVDIRLRNLEFARESALNIPTSELDRATILSGNVAAHRANDAVDAAIFKAGLVPEDRMEETTTVFKKLYILEPEVYPTIWHTRIKRVLDCRATIMTVKSVAGSGDCKDLILEHNCLDLELSKMYDGMFIKDQFENDPTVEERLLRLEMLTEEIVDIKRSKGRRRGKYRTEVSYPLNFEITNFDTAFWTPSSSAQGTGKTNAESWVAGSDSGWGEANVDSGKVTNGSSTVAGVSGWGEATVDPWRPMNNRLGKATDSW
ncbi:hypothetical protein VTL71DRAFT_8638 [Oculimacula yallundae]|uniref:Uncharacterized protein n=1 Tax=Oculimacula yallundae TaxID=86028 RepID=A0ABR4CY87_9HELO